MTHRQTVCRTWAACLGVVCLFSGMALMAFDTGPYAGWVPVGSGAAALALAIAGQ